MTPPQWATRHLGWSRSLDGGLLADWDQAILQKRSDGWWWVKAGNVQIKDRLLAPEFDVVLECRVGGTDWVKTAVLDKALGSLTRLLGGSLDARVRPHGDGYLIVVAGSTAAELNGVT